MVGTEQTSPEGHHHLVSVADPGCLSQIQDHDFCPSRIPDPKTLKKERGETFFCSHKYHKIENYFIFELVKKKIWENLQRIIELFISKNSH
jgi:hypothetical protein